MISLYVASSWRNHYQPKVVESLRLAGFQVYDFKNPAPGNHGFNWKSIDPKWIDWNPRQWCDALQTPLAEEGYKNDRAGMDAAGACVLVLPSGRSAHLEAGFMAGQGKPVFVFAPADYGEADLMVKLFAPHGNIVCSISELIYCLREWAASLPLKLPK